MRAYHDIAVRIALAYGVCPFDGFFIGFLENAEVKEHKIVITDGDQIVMVSIIVEASAVPCKILISFLTEIFAEKAVIRNGMINIMVAAYNTIRHTCGI